MTCLIGLHLHRAAVRHLYRAELHFDGALEMRLIDHLGDLGAGHARSYLSRVGKNRPHPVKGRFYCEGVGKFHSYLAVAALHALALHLRTPRSLLGFCLGQTALLRRRLIKTPALELRDNSLRVALPSLEHALEVSAPIFQLYPLRSLPPCT